MQQLPAPPDIDVEVPVAPPRKRRIGWIIAAVVGGLLILGAIGEATDKAEERQATSDAPVLLEPSDQEPDYTATSELMFQVSDELSQITDTSPVSSDIAHLNTAASLCDQAAAMFEGTTHSEQVAYLNEAADHLRAAAVAEGSGDFATAAAEMDAFAEIVDEATTALG